MARTLLFSSTSKTVSDQIVKKENKETPQKLAGESHISVGTGLLRFGILVIAKLLRMTLFVPFDKWTENTTHMTCSYLFGRSMCTLCTPSRYGGKLKRLRKQFTDDMVIAQALHL